MAENSKPRAYDCIENEEKMTNLNSRHSWVPKHVRDKMICSALDDNLRQQYIKLSMRAIKGDSVKVVRGEYTGIEGKVEKVNTEQGTLAIEGVQREKVKGGNVKVPIHASNVIITGLNLNDKFRVKKLQSSSRKAEGAVEHKPRRKEVLEEIKTDEKVKEVIKEENGVKKMMLKDRELDGEVKIEEGLD